MSARHIRSRLAGAFTPACDSPSDGASKVARPYEVDVMPDDLFPRRRHVQFASYPRANEIDVGACNRDLGALADTRAHLVNFIHSGDPHDADQHAHHFK